jgi:hypothetical protein
VRARRAPRSAMDGREVIPILLCATPTLPKTQPIFALSSPQRVSTFIAKAPRAAPRITHSRNCAKRRSGVEVCVDYERYASSLRRRRQRTSDDDLEPIIITYIGCKQKRGGVREYGQQKARDEEDEQQRTPIVVVIGGVYTRVHVHHPNQQRSRRDADDAHKRCRRRRRRGRRIWQRDGIQWFERRRPGGGLR